MCIHKKRILQREELIQNWNEEVDLVDELLDKNFTDRIQLEKKRDSLFENKIELIRPSLKFGFMDYLKTLYDFINDFIVPIPERLITLCLHPRNLLPPLFIKKNK